MSSSPDLDHPAVNDVVARLLAHRSIRRFTDDPVPDDDVRAAIRAGQRAATSSNVQAYAIIRVRETASRERLVELTGGQDKVRDCGAFFVIAADTRRHRLMARRADAAYDGRLETFLVGVIDASLFAQNVVVAFESMGYGTCYIGGLRNDLPAVQELLEFPEGVCPIFGLCVGRPAQDPMPRPRLGVDAVLMEERYASDDAVLASVDEYDARLREWYAERGEQETDWSSRMARNYVEPRRVGLAAFYEAQGARLD